MDMSAPLQLVEDVLAARRENATVKSELVVVRQLIDVMSGGERLWIYETLCLLLPSTQ